MYVTIWCYFHFITTLRDWNLTIYFLKTIRLSVAPHTHTQSLLQDNTDSRSVLPFCYTTTLTARVFSPDMGYLPCSFPHGQRSFRVHCGCCMSFSYSCLTPTSRPGAHLTNLHFRWAAVCVRAWVYVCLCEFTVNISTACASHFRVSLERWDRERMTSLPKYGCVGIPPHYSLLQCIPIPCTFGSYHLIAAGGGVCAAKAHYLWLMEHCVPLVPSP